VKLINTLQITQKKRYDREMGSSEVMVGKVLSSASKDGECGGSRTAFFDVEVGKNAAWALLIMWALHRKSHHTIYDLPLIGETFQNVS